MTVQGRGQRQAPASVQLSPLNRKSPTASPVASRKRRAGGGDGGESWRIKWRRLTVTSRKRKRDHVDGESPEGNASKLQHVSLSTADTSGPVTPVSPADDITIDVQTGGSPPLASDQPPPPEEQVQREERQSAETSDVVDTGLTRGAVASAEQLQESVPPESTAPQPNPWSITCVLLFFVYYGLSVLLFAVGHFKGHKTKKALDAIYFGVVTLTTVGYGDLVVTSELGKVLSIFHVVAGAILNVILQLVSVVWCTAQEKVMLYIMERLCCISATTRSQPSAPVKACAAFIAVLAYCFIGVVMMVLAWHIGVLDSLYTSTVSMATVGYGDFTCTTSIARALVSAWLVFSTTTFSHFCTSLVVAILPRFWRLGFYGL